MSDKKCGNATPSDFPKRCVVTATLPRTVGWVSKDPLVCLPHRAPGAAGIQFEIEKKNPDHLSMIGVWFRGEILLHFEGACHIPRCFGFHLEEHGIPRQSRILL